MRQDKRKWIDNLPAEVEKAGRDGRINNVFNITDT